MMNNVKSSTQDRPPGGLLDGEGEVAEAGANAKRGIGQDRHSRLEATPPPGHSIDESPNSNPLP